MEWTAKMEGGIKDFTRSLQGDKVMWGICIVLSMISILVVYSATSALAYKNAGGDTEHYLLKHALLVLLGLAAAWVFHRIDYRYYSRLSRVALIASVLMLLFAWRFGATINEASRWIVIPFVNQSFQPSDMARLALILNVASMLSKRQGSLQDFQRAIMPVLVWCGLVCCCISLTDFSGGAILFATCMLIMFVGRVPVRYIGMMVLVGVLAGLLAFNLGQRGQTVSNRAKAYFEASGGEIPFQAQQSNIAIAMGGFVGQGAGKSIQRNFLPHPYSDFIFAIIIEEYGMVGAMLIMSLYLALIYRGMMVAAQSENAFGGLLAAGLTFGLAIQAFIHMGVVVGLLPITGLPMPLLSMGGTSLLFTGITVGIILSVSRNAYGEDGEGIPASAFSKSGINLKKGNVRRNMA